MPTDRYITTPITIQHQAGDTGDIVITVPAAISLAGKTLRFAVLKGTNTIFEKTQPDLTVSVQDVIIPMLEADTNGLYGTYHWELELMNSNATQVITLGQGDFIIIRTYIQ